MDIKIDIKEIIGENAKNGYIPVELITDRGEVSCRFYKVNSNNLSVIWVGGVGGGWDTPAEELYPDLSEKLKKNSISSLRIRYRYPHDLEESVYDVLAGIRFLKNVGASKIALVGHSLGGAVVIQAAASSSSVKTVVALSTQSHGTNSVSNFSQGTSILIIHGSDDPVLPINCSKQVYNKAHDPKEIVILTGNAHCLDESSEKVHQIVYDWIVSELTN
ncbi:alpha/beta hydrolase [Methanobacterium sp. MBAC-LM]|uniref:alpha/beta hydrolase n=1 Tax=Methanobacterium sp. MBAC-LM TaxID=3412034 RepID=UPI003C78A80E